METAQFILIYTFILGSLYLLISLGFSVICGVLRVFHLGYGVIFIVAVYVTWMFMKEFGLGLIPAIAAMCVVQALFTWLIIYLPIVKRYFEKEEMILTSLLLVALIAEEAANYVYPVTAGVHISTTIIPGIVRIGASTIPNQMLIAAGMAILVTALFVVFLLKTRSGLLMRAASQDTWTARLMGTNVERIYIYAMILSVIPPTICILNLAPIWAIEPDLGWSFLETAILVAILGGLGNLRGSIMAAYILGFVASTVSFIINPRLMGLACLIVVVVVLILRPRGIARSESLW